MQHGMLTRSMERAMMATYCVILTFFVEITMAIKKNRITPQDVEDVIACGYPLAQIAREAGVDRIALSKFRNHGQALKAADQAALATWLQANNLWEEVSASDGGDDQAGPEPTVEVVNAKRFHFPVDDDVSDDTLSSVLSTIRTNDKRLSDLLTQEATRDDGFFGSGEFTEETLQALRESMSLLASNYLMIRAVSGWPEVGLSASNDNIAGDKVLSAILDSMRDQFEAAGLIAPNEPGVSGPDLAEEEVK